MVQLPDVYRPRLPRRIGIHPVYESVQREFNAIHVGQELEQIVKDDFPSVTQSSTNFRSVSFALAYRDKLLCYFPAADQVRCTLARCRYSGIQPDIAIAMVSALMGVMGARGDEGALSEMLGGFIELIEGDSLGMWEPLNVTSVTLAMACRKLNATSKFFPKPAELAEACREAWYQMIIVLEYCERLCDFVVKCDAALLKFAHSQWFEPYLQPQYQAVGQRMLELHSLSDDEDFVFLVEQVLWGIPSLNRKSGLPELSKS